MNLDRNLLFAFALLVFFPSCAGDIKGEAGPAGSDALSSPTLTIRGGGKISWNAATNEVSFTDDLIIYDHQIGSTITITPSASTVTLADQDDVAYVERLLVDGGNNEVTRIDVAPLSRITEQNSSRTLLVLFHRTTDDTLWLPWVQRELLSGDFWQFGTASSWYERVASARKPAYRNTTNGGTKITVTASNHEPAVAIIDGKVYANTEDTLCEFDPATEDGCLDSGSIQANTPYYLYAVPSDTGRSFRIVASESDPMSGGPDQNVKWSYIGSTATNEGAATFTPFSATEGTIIFTNEIFKDSVTATVRTEVIITNLPLTVKYAFIQLAVAGSTAAATGEISAVNLSHDSIIVGRISTGIGSVTAGPTFVPVLVPQSTWLFNSNASNTTSIDLHGWKEDPMSFK